MTSKKVKNLIKIIFLQMKFFGKTTSNQKVTGVTIKNQNP